MPSHNEPCTRCPEFVVRCGHLEEDVVYIADAGYGSFTVVGPWGAGLPGYPISPYFAARPTRAEADAEFERREEALLA